MFTFDNTRTQNARQRFLDAYRERLAIAPAARLAGIHRSTVYRWMEEPEFVAALRSAADDYFRMVKARSLEQKAIRDEQRRMRAQADWEVRRRCLAIARAARRR